ncbi:MAG: LPS-assembly protein LptD [Gammaproteobacteria bacterium]
MLHRRFFLIYSCMFYSVSGLADSPASAWNCKQTEGGKEWLCVSESKSAKQPPATATAPASPPAEEIGIAEPSEVTRQPLPVAKLQPLATIPPPAAEQKPEGWTCNANTSEDTWDCNLVGIDPRGQAKVMGEEPRQLGFLTPAFDIRQEQIFTRLQNALPADPWQNCTTPWVEGYQYAVQSDIRESSSMNIRADYSETFDQEISNFWGDVEISRADQHLNADSAHYDSVSQVLDAQGNVMYSENQLALFSRSAQVQLAADKARVRDALFIAPTVPLRGSAKSMFRESKSFSRYEDVAYTSCRPGNQDWVVHGSQLKMNRTTGRASVKNAWLEFKGLPVMYLPYMSFPVDNRRLSGFLSPSFGNTKKNGVDINVPYYWNIAPNYDALTWARYLENRGPLLGGRFRYLTHITKGEVDFEVLPYDLEKDKTRWQGAFINEARFNDNWSSSTSVQRVSDNTYYEDLSSPLRITTASYLNSYTNLNYQAPGVGFMTKLDYYQNIDPAQPESSSPYRRLPQMLLNLNKSFDSMPLNIGMNNEFVYFQHPSRNDIGSRINIKPYLTFPFESPGAFVRPRLSLQSTQYVLDNRLAGLPDSINRTLPIVSLDSGLIMERELGAGDSFYRQTLEPRLFYVYIPYENQNDLPIYDTALYDFNFNQMFLENRFSGSDRLGDANQVTVALTSRLLQGHSGTELLNLSVGEIFYFRDRKVTQPIQTANPADPNTFILTPGTIQTSAFSNLVTQLSGQLTDNLSFLTGLQWDPTTNNIDRGNATMRYTDTSNAVFNAGYRYRRNVTDQAQQSSQQSSSSTLIHLTDFSVHWPIFNDWSVIGRWQYSLLDNLTLEAFAGIEKESCCWRLRLIGRRYLNSINNDPQNALFMQVELKGLTSFGQDLDDFLERSIFGYRNPNR